MTNDCKVLMDQADRMKASRDAQHPSTYSKPKGKRPYANNYTKEEVNRIVNLATKKAVAKEKASSKPSVTDHDTEDEINQFSSFNLSEVNSDEDYQKL